MIDGNEKSPRTLNLTPNTAEGWGSLLGLLTEEELNQYGRIAQDQIRRETRWRWAQILAGFAAAGLTVWMSFRLFQGGMERFRWLPLGLVVLLSYWPYRGRKTRRLWQGHYEAVQAELARRQQQTE